MPERPAQHKKVKNTAVAMFQTAGAKLAYEVEGPDSGPLFVQMHGLTSSAWREHRAGLDVTGQLAGFRVLRYDSRGHGSSTGRAVPEDYIWSQLADDLLELLDAVAPGEQVHTGGPSMGAATQIHAALKDPQRFASMSLLVPPTAWATRREQTDQYLRSAELVEDHGIGAFIRMGESMLPPPALADRPRERVPAVSQELLPSILRGASLADLPTPEEIAQLEVPIQIMAWVDDHAHPVSTAEKLNSLHAESQLSIAETPEDLATWPTRVANFVQRHCR